jgi:hypothetical protein
MNELTYNVTLSTDAPQNARNYDGDKERTETHKVLALLPEKGPTGESRYKTLVDLRLWMGRSRNASTVYASVWLRSFDGSTHRSGRGTAGGGGYCKASGASDAALASAGVKVCDADGRLASIHGAGMPEIDKVLLLLGRALLGGADVPMILVEA